MRRPALLAGICARAGICAHSAPCAGAVAQLSTCSGVREALSTIAVVRDEDTNWGSWLAASSALLLPAAAAVVAHADAGGDGAASRSSAWQGLLPLETKRRVFFKYEKRMRENSQLEKVFDYFSSQERDGLKFMTPLDLLAAIVPTYPPSQSQQERSGSLDGEPPPHTVVHERLQKASATVFNKFDVDGDGVLSFWEYRLVLTLLAIPEGDMEVIFNVVDMDGSGTVDAQEFEEVVASLEGRGPGTRQHMRAPGSRLGRGAAVPATATPSGLLLSFFGPDQKGKLKLTQFMTFLNQLHSDMIDLEFSHYDVHDKGSIPGVDYLRSLVAVADIQHVDALMDKIDALPADLLQTPVSKKDFRNMATLARKGHSLEVALYFCSQVGKPVTSAELSKLFKKICGVQLSTKTLDLIMALFSDEQGQLDVPTFCSVIHRRRKLWMARANTDQEGNGASLSAFWKCVKACGSGGDVLAKAQRE